jgi:hypothetical protein
VVAAAAAVLDLSAPCLQAVAAAAVLELDFSLDRQKHPMTNQLDFSLDRQKHPMANQLDFSLDRQKHPMTNQLDFSLDRQKHPMANQLDLPASRLQAAAAAFSLVEPLKDRCQCHTTPYCSYIFVPYYSNPVFL